MGPHAYLSVQAEEAGGMGPASELCKAAPKASPLLNLPSLLPAYDQASKAAGEGSKKAAGGGKRKKPTQGEGAGEDGGGEDGGAEAAPAPAGPKWGSVKVREPEPGGTGTWQQCTLSE